MSAAFDIVVACDLDNCIGLDGDLPWHLPGDLRHLVNLTRTAPSGKRNAVIMGRTTWESIPRSYRPLVGRLNVVLTRSGALEVPDGVELASSFDAALAIEPADLDHRFVLGGGKVYELAVAHPQCRWIYLTRVLERYNGDTFFPKLDDSWERAELMSEDSHDGVGYRIERWARAPRS